MSGLKSQTTTVAFSGSALLQEFVNKCFTEAEEYDDDEMILLELLPRQQVKETLKQWKNLFKKNVEL